MNSYIIKYEIQGKILRSNEVVVKANTMIEAQNKFLEHLKDAVNEAWRVSFEIKLISEL
jgi:hypothetical protein